MPIRRSSRNRSVRAHNRRDCRRYDIPHVLELRSHFPDLKAVAAALQSENVSVLNDLSALTKAKAAVWTPGNPDLSAIDAEATSRGATAPKGRGWRVDRSVLGGHEFMGSRKE